MSFLLHTLIVLANDFFLSEKMNVTAWKPSANFVIIF